MKKLGVFLLVFGASALFNRAELSSVDEGFIFNSTAALVEKHSWRMDEELSGRRYSRFSPLPSIMATPFYALANILVEGPFPVGAAKMRDWLLFASGLSSCVLTAWTAVALSGLFRSLKYSEHTAVWTSLLWAFGTLAFPYSSSLFHQVTATLLMVYVVRFSLEGRIAATALTTALLVSIQLTLAATVLPLFLRNRGQPKWRTLFGLAIGILGGFGLHVLTNWLRGDHWLHGAYETETFTTPTFVGTVGLFFSSGKGLLWFAPLAFVGLLMLLPFAYRRPDIGRPLLFAVTCHCLVVIHWWAWHGSLSWGPRLLLPILPLMMIPIADLIERRHELPVWQPRLLGSVAVVSVLINMWGATQPMIGFLGNIPGGAMSEWVFVPSLSPLVNGFRSAFPWESSTTTLLVRVGTTISCLLLTGWLIGRHPASIGVIVIAPWRSLFVVIAAHFFAASDHGLSTLTFTQYGSLDRWEGLMDFPIRGQYRVELESRSDERLTIGANRLSKNHPVALIEAPPMSQKVEVQPGDKEGAVLRWTLPGEGQYRVEVPPEQVYVAFDGKRRLGRPISEAIAWLLYLLAVPLYFDWLLGGRRMKEARLVGTEANK